METETERNNKYHFSEEQLKAVEEGQLQYKKGLFLTEEQADKEIEEWLGNTID